MENKLKNILIIGLGLIGSSMALGIRRDHPNVKLFGLDNEETINTALQNHLIDQAARLDQVTMMDLVILATPIDATFDLLTKISQMNFSHELVLTDTCSTKNEIMIRANQIFNGKNIKFIGGHPMAGSHKSGVNAADVNLFENAYYVLTERNEELQDILSGLHSKFIIVDPKEHDQVTGQVSHFPHIIASSLVQQSNTYSKKHPLVNHLAAGGFRDMTRIAEANSKMWTSVILSNRHEIIERIKDFKGDLDRIIKFIEEKDEIRISEFFDSGKKIRQNMEILKGRGVIPNFYDLFVSVPDEKGVILKILVLLQDISITNIKINEENREDIHGQLQISFKSASDLEQAKEIIEGATDFDIAE